MLLAVGCGHRDVAKCLEHTEGECGRALATARECDDDEEFVRIRRNTGRRHRRGERHDVLERLFAGRNTAAGGKRHRGAERERSATERTHAAQYTAPSVDKP